VEGSYTSRGGGVFHEGVDDDGRCVRHQDHVGLLDALPAGDGGAVEHLAVFKEAGVDGVRGDGQMLLFAAGVGEAQIDELGLFLL
jgi:hypothetical protein